MPRSPKDNQDIRDARREEILAAATKVFAEKGFGQTKISDIASAAGLSHGLVYHYFDSKDAIFGAIVDSMIERIDRDLEEVASVPAYERIRRGLERARERALGPVDAQRLVSQATMQGSIPEEIRARLCEHRSGIHDRVVAWIAEAQSDGEVDPAVPAAELAASLMCLIRGMSIRMPGMQDLPFSIPRTETILRLLQPPRAPARPPATTPTEKPAGARRRKTAPRGTHATRTRRD